MHSSIFLRLTDTESGITYNIYPEGQQGQCNAGATGVIYVRLRNDGDAQAYIYMIMTRLDTNQQLFNYSFYLAPNATADITPANFVMPAVDLVLQFEIGHFG